MIDLRSDTVTKPSRAMRHAMASADVGDDVYGEDPTVNRLEALAAERLGKEAAVLVSSGTMANQTAVRAQTSPGDVVLAGEGAHVLRAEAGGAAAVSGVQIEVIGEGGFFRSSDVGAAIPPHDDHYAPATLLCAENTHNSAGGRVFDHGLLVKAVELAHERGLRCHLDGARIFNAQVASGVPAAAWAEPFDTVSFCLSKGLGAPVGSLVCGSAEVIARVRRVRKMLGGGMRQAGILAAAGVYALEHNVDRLADDHANATRLAEGLEELGVKVDPAPETNIVFFKVEGGVRAFLEALRERGVLAGASGGGRVRAVTHLDVDADAIEDTIERIGSVLRG